MTLINLDTCRTGKHRTLLIFSNISHKSRNMGTREHKNDSHHIRPPLFWPWLHHESVCDDLLHL